MFCNNFDCDLHIKYTGCNWAEITVSLSRILTIGRSKRGRVYYCDYCLMTGQGVKLLPVPVLKAAHE